jgi:TonB family protein
VAEVELSVDAKGRVTEYRWLKGSGDKRWDDSVKAVVAQTTALSRPPPKGFPDKFPVRFDVETSRTEPVVQLTSQ